MWWYECVRAHGAGVWWRGYRGFGLMAWCVDCRAELKHMPVRRAQPGEPGKP
jgi:hypothetical protein